VNLKSETKVASKAPAHSHLAAALPKKVQPVSQPVKAGQKAAEAGFGGWTASTQSRSNVK
jgi:hypothetical protein